MSEKKPNCYLGLFNKIDHIDARIGEIRAQLATLKENFSPEAEEDYCPDELEAEEALLEIMSAGAIAALLETDPQGDA
jgi:hypothetical protein